MFRIQPRLRLTVLIRRKLLLLSERDCRIVVCRSSRGDIPRNQHPCAAKAEPNIRRSRQENRSADQCC